MVNRFCMLQDYSIKLLLEHPQAAANAVVNIVHNAWCTVNNKTQRKLLTDTFQQITQKNTYNYTLVSPRALLRNGTNDG